MNVNGSRFDLLLGRADFGRCLRNPRNPRKEYEMLHS